MDENEKSSSAIDAESFKGTNESRIEPHWKFDGSIWEFLGTVQWAFVFRELGRSGRRHVLEIVSKPDQVEEAAQEYGITYRALANEMQRISKDALRMFAILDASEDDGRELPPEELEDIPELTQEQAAYIMEQQRKALATTNGDLTEARKLMRQWEHEKAYKRRIDRSQEDRSKCSIG